MAETEQDGVTSSNRRSRRKVAREKLLAQARQVDDQQQAEARQRQERFGEAIREFAEATAQVMAAEEDRDRQIGRHERKIEELRADCEATVSGSRAAQAQAALKLQDQAGRTIEQIAELLGVSMREVRRMIVLARDAPGDNDVTAPSSPKPPRRHKPARRARVGDADQPAQQWPAAEPGEPAEPDERAEPGPSTAAKKKQDSAGEDGAVDVSGRGAPSAAATTGRGHTEPDAASAGSRAATSNG